MDLEIEAASQGVPDIRAALETLNSNGQAAVATLSPEVSFAGSICWVCCSLGGAPPPPLQNIGHVPANCQVRHVRLP